MTNDRVNYPDARTRRLPNMFRTFSKSSLLIAGLVMSLFAPVASAAENALKELVVFPTQVSLSNQQDRQSMVVQAVLANGLTEDVSLKAAIKLENPGLVKMDKAVLWPVADGETKMTVEFGGKSVVVPVKVSGSKTVLPISFRMDVMPVFMKANCNTGSCHGAARGKDGFRLSLFGFDPEGDHHRLTREMPGRRLNQAVPAESTLIEKAVGAVQHTGGKRIEPGTEMYQTLIRWIETGSPNDDVAKLPKLVDVQLARSRQCLMAREPASGCRSLRSILTAQTAT